MAKKLLPPPNEVLKEDHVSYSVEVVIFEYRIPATKSYEDAVEFEMHDERLLVGFDSLEEAQKYAKDIVRKYTEYDSEREDL